VKRHVFYILLSLVDRDRHGSDIARDVNELTKGDLKLWPVTLYGSLQELVEQGLIEALTDSGRHPSGESERKRYFRITRAGRRAVEHETRRLSELVEAAERRLLHPREAR
jgi:DNA-binding PadR family transcriptional regulator